MSQETLPNGWTKVRIEPFGGILMSFHKVIQRGKQIAMLRWEEFTDAAIQRMSHNGNMWFYLVLHARMERDGVCVQDRRISIPLPFSTRKRQRLFDYVRKSKLKIDYAGGEAEEIDARLR